MQTAASGKISIREKICYGLGDASANIFLGMTMMFLPYFYTDVVGLTAGAMGTLFLIARFIDAFSDPLIGNFADQHSTRFGHYRPFLLFLAIPYGLSCFLVFQAPDLSYTGKLIYAFVSYIFLILMYAGTVVPYVGLLSVLTDNPMERLSINSFRFPLAKSAFLLCSVVVPMFVASYGVGHEALAYKHAMSIIGVLAAGCTLICFFGTKERSKPLIIKDENDSLLSKLKVIATNKNLRSFYVFFALTQAAFTFKGSSAIYYAKYYLGQNDAYLTGLLSAFSIASILGPIVSMWLINRGIFSKLGMLKFATLGAAVTLVPLMLVPAQYYILSSSFLILSTFFGELGIVVYWALPADCAEYCQLNYHKKMNGVLGAVALFSQKFAMALVGAGIGLVLTLVSYQANGPVTPAVTNGILAITSILPIACHLISYYFLNNYKLDEKAMREVHFKLADLYAKDMDVSAALK